MQAKKKLTALLLSLCMVLGMLPMTVFAAGGTTTSGLTYEDNGDSVTITGSAWGGRKSHNRVQNKRQAGHCYR